MKLLAPLKLANLAIAEGATSPVPSDGTGAVVFSTTLGKIVVWDGSKWSTGAAAAGVAFEALSAGNLIYVRSDGTIAKANATSAGKEAIGFVTQAYAQGASVAYFNYGLITGLSGLTVGAPYFMGTIPGGVASASGVPASTGNVLLQIGTANSATSIAFNLGLSILL